MPTLVGTSITSLYLLIRVFPNFETTQGRGFQIENKQYRI